MLTVPQVAKLLKVRRERISGWIEAGALRAIDLAEPGQRHQYRVSSEWVEDFKTSRAVAPPATLLSPGEVEYYR